MSDASVSLPLGTLVGITKRKGSRPQTYLIVQFDNTKDSLTAIISSSSRACRLTIGEMYIFHASRMFNRCAPQTVYNGKKLPVTRTLDRSPIAFIEHE